ncbi:hypothetical protein DRJ17_06045 [Candidatus Woesearchaeota archaeon]|nr:MAG: hypothetical protein DRJ17_06045 [Candidatus Woesearchaeota archaeon]
MVRIGKRESRKKSRIASKEKERIKESIVDGFEMKGQFSGKKKDLFDSLSKLTFLEIAERTEGLVAINVESRDIRKRPLLFSIIYFDTDRIKVLYSCVAGMSPKKRRLDILSYFLNILTVVGDNYSVDEKEIYQLLQNAIKDMSEYVTLDYERMYAEHDSLKDEIERIKKEEASLRESNDLLSRENYELKTRLEDYKIRLEKYESISDETLSVKLQEWISEHAGQINITDFSKVYEIPESRVEQMLNKMVMKGYLESRG